MCCCKDVYALRVRPQGTHEARRTSANHSRKRKKDRRLQKQRPRRKQEASMTMKRQTQSSKNDVSQTHTTSTDHPICRTTRFHRSLEVYQRAHAPQDHGGSSLQIAVLVAETPTIATEAPYCHNALQGAFRHSLLSNLLHHLNTLLQGLWCCQELLHDSFRLELMSNLIHHFNTLLLRREPHKLNEFLQELWHKDCTICSCVRFIHSCGMTPQLSRRPP